MKFLIIGGTYFFGRVFTMLAGEKHELHLIHRGTYSMKDFGVAEYILDRHDPAALEAVETRHFDGVIDFCGYEPGDIRDFFTYFRGTFDRYIFVSTADVYERTVGAGRASILKKEDFPLERRRFGGEAGAYIANKVTLEQELKESCAQRGISYTIVRPSILYGPYNYAPREAEYIRRIVQEGVVCFPKDAGGAFQLVYVKDAALMLQALCENPETKNQAYNLCSDEILDYGDFLELLKASADREFRVEELPVSEMLRRAMFLPFPATSEETQLCDGRKVIETTGCSLTSAAEGIKRTYAAFAGVFDPDLGE